MNIHLIAVGTRMPAWVREGYGEYAKRLNRDCRLKLTEIPPGYRGKRPDIPRTLREEGERILSAIPGNCRVLALDVRGRSWSTGQLAKKMAGWMNEGRDTALLIGGPEGLADECLKHADERWSLSPLTLPHPLVRVVLAEQLYRAWTILNHHPYHRG